MAGEQNVAWETVRRWAPVVAVFLSLIALFVTSALLIGGAISRSETRLSRQITAQTDALMDDVRSVRSLTASVQVEMHAWSRRLSFLEGQTDSLFHLAPDGYTVTPRPPN